MKLPVHAPSLAESTKDIVPSLPPKQSFPPTPLDARGHYLHWDELRRKPAPSGFTHEQWWWFTKLARLHNRVALPLRDRSGFPFSFIVPGAALEILHRIDRDAAGHIAVDEQVIEVTNRDRYIVASLIEEAITSSQLEGAATTRAVAKQLLKSGRPPRGKDEQMILNNFSAMNRIRDLRTEPLTPEIVLELHAEVTHDTLEEPDAAGRFRRASEDVCVRDNDDQVLHRPPPAQQLPERLRRMCSFANGKADKGFVHPVVRAILIHFWLAYDHPFVDGNGRTARALFYWCMLHNGYWLFEFIPISRVIKQARAQYARAFLHAEDDENDATYFIMHQLGVITRALDDLRAYLTRKMAEQRQFAQVMMSREDLNSRQRALLAHALRYGRSEYTISGHQRSHQVAYQTARTDMLDLVDRKFLEQRKSGRKFVFVPVKDLGSKLQHTKIPTAK